MAPPVLPLDLLIAKRTASGAQLLLSHRLLPIKTDHRLTDIARNCVTSDEITADKMLASSLSNRNSVLSDAKRQRTR